jgi:hypothetical protein
MDGYSQYSMRGKKQKKNYPLGDAQPQNAASKKTKAEIKKMLIFKVPI